MGFGKAVRAHGFFVEDLLQWDDRTVCGGRGFGVVQVRDFAGSERSVNGPIIKFFAGTSYRALSLVREIR